MLASGLTNRAVPRNRRLEAAHEDLWQSSGGWAGVGFVGASVVQAAARSLGLELAGVRACVLCVVRCVCTVTVGHARPLAEVCLRGFVRVS